MIKSFYISLSYATFAITCKGDLIIEVAPIAQWMKGKTLQEIKPWLLKRKAIVKKLK